MGTLHLKNTKLLTNDKSKTGFSCTSFFDQTQLKYEFQFEKSWVLFVKENVFLHKQFLFCFFKDRTKIMFENDIAYFWNGGKYVF